MHNKNDCKFPNKKEIPNILNIPTFLKYQTPKTVASKSHKNCPFVQINNQTNKQPLSRDINCHNYLVTRLLIHTHSQWSLNCTKIINKTKQNKIKQTTKEKKKKKKTKKQKAKT